MIDLQANVALRELFWSNLPS
uniref:Uncharacterized protein n=1 Tax=Anguilla anguilla TaxID=7936 RepID=A0A0E9VW97_ANGAN